MRSLHIHLFGKLCVQHGDTVLPGLDARRVQELLAYLLLRRDQPHPRERLADVMWGESDTHEVRKGLRQALWKLQSVLKPTIWSDSGLAFLNVDAEYVEINAGAGFWLDVAVLEQAWTRVKGIAGPDLDAVSAGAVTSAVAVYRGDLLEGWYQDWCLFERERLQAMYLDLLHKLMGHAEASGAYDAGIEHGMAILRVDHARERTHRRLMRLRYLAGDRCGALRQYERCAAALREELGVTPARRTDDLRARICADASLDDDAATVLAPSDGRREFVTAKALTVVHGTVSPSHARRSIDRLGAWRGQATALAGAQLSDAEPQTLEAVLADLIQLRGTLLRAEQRIISDIAAVGAALRRGARCGD